MAVQTFNEDVVKKLEVVKDLFRDELFKKMKEGLEAAKECANDSGSAKLVRSCDAALEGTEAMVKVFDSLMDCVDRYQEQINRTQSVFE